MLNRFFPIVPSNCTSTNSVSCSISLFRTIPPPNMLCRTLSPGLYCCPLGVGGVAFCGVGPAGGTVDQEYEPGRGVHLAGAGLPPPLRGLPFPNVLPLSRQSRCAFLYL